MVTTTEEKSSVPEKKSLADILRIVISILLGAGLVGLFIAMAIRGR